MPTAELVYAGPDGTDGDVVGAVEIIDAGLMVVGGSVVRARQAVPVQLPVGRYLARGVMPSGGRVRALFDVAADVTVTLTPRQRGPVPAARPSSWIHGWSYRGRTWQPDMAIQHRDDVFEAQLPSDADALSMAIRVGGDGLAPQTVVLLPQTPVTLAWTQRPSGSQWHVRPADGVANAIVDYLHRGEFALAEIVAQQPLAASDGPGEAMPALTAIAVGYYLLLSGDVRARRWIGELVWRWPDTVDVAVLNGCLLRGDPDSSETAVVDEFTRAAASGLPTLARGLRLLVSGLAAAASYPEAAAMAARIRPYANALGDGPMTALHGASPNEPSATPAPPIAAPPAGAVIVPARRPDPGTTRPALPQTAQDDLREALQRLRTSRFGLTPANRRIPIGDVAVVADTVRHGDDDLLNLALAVDRATGGPLPLDDVIIDLDIDSRQHCLAVFDAANRCTFTAVPAGRWELSLRTRIPNPDGSHALPMPTPPAAEFAMAATDDSIVVMSTLLPTDQGLSVLRREKHGGRYRLEFVRASRPGVSAVGVSYGRHDGGGAFMIVPVAPSRSGRSSSTLWLDGFDVSQPWSVQTEMDPSMVARLSIDTIKWSVRQTPSESGDAWRELAELLPEPSAAIVRSELVRHDNPGRS